MKLDEVIHRKREMALPSGKTGSSGRHELSKEVERIFKWKTMANIVSTTDSTILLDLVVPPGISQDDFEFVERMLKRKLPSLIATHLGDGREMGEIRHLHPMMKAMRGQKIQRGIPPKIRVPIQ